jgi:hypothetical protein
MKPLLMPYFFIKPPEYSRGCATADGHAASLGYSVNFYAAPFFLFISFVFPHLHPFKSGFF